MRPGDIIQLTDDERRDLVETWREYRERADALALFYSRVHARAVLQLRTTHPELAGWEFEFKPTTGALLVTHRSQDI